MEIFRHERSPSRLTRLMLAVPTAAALLFAATGAHAQECASDADCAPGFECAWVGESNSVGGGPGPVCGDDSCDAGETEESCPQDCSDDRTCQVAHQLCNEDEECAPGFYCDDEGGGVTSFGVVTGSTTGGMSYDGTCAVIGTTSGVGGGSATDGGAGAATDATDGSGEGSTVNSATTVGGVNTTGGSDGNPSGGSGGGGNGGPSGGNGGPSGGNGNGHGGGHGHGPWKPWPGHPGCSVGGTGAPAGGLFLTALAGLGAIFVRRRRS